MSIEKPLLWKKPKTTKSTNPDRSEGWDAAFVVNIELWILVAALIKLQYGCSFVDANSSQTSRPLTSFIYICRPLLLAERKLPKFGLAYSKRTVSRQQSIHIVDNAFMVCVNCWRGLGVDAIHLRETGNSDWADESAVTSDGNFPKQFRDKVIKQPLLEVSDCWTSLRRRFDIVPEAKHRSHYHTSAQDWKRMWTNEKRGGG